MRLSKIKIRAELRRTLENLKNCGFTYQQSLCLIAATNAIATLQATLEFDSEKANLLDSVLREVYGIETAEDDLPVGPVHTL